MARLAHVWIVELARGADWGEKEGGAMGIISVVDMEESERLRELRADIAKGYGLVWNEMAKLQARIAALEHKAVKPRPKPSRAAPPPPADEDGVIKRCGNCDEIMAGTAVCGIDELEKDLASTTECSDWRRRAAKERAAKERAAGLPPCIFREGELTAQGVTTPACQAIPLPREPIYVSGVHCNACPVRKPPESPADDGD